MIVRPYYLTQVQKLGENHSCGWKEGPIHFFDSQKRALLALCTKLLLLVLGWALFCLPLSSSKPIASWRSPSALLLSALVTIITNTTTRFGLRRATIAFLGPSSHIYIMVARTACRSLLRAQRSNLSTSTARASSSSASSSSSSSSTAASTSSSAASTSASWQPLLKPGVLPAYDEALAFLSSHSTSLRSRLARLDDEHPDLTPADKAALRESLEIAAAINEPSVLAAFQASSPTSYDAGNAAFRHLRERVWRHDSGVLAKVVERCTLMQVLPDVVPAVTPLADVQVSFGEGDGYTDHVSNGGDVLVVKNIVTNNVQLVASEDIDDDTAAAIAEISQNATGGIKLKLHDKKGALVDIGRHLGMFVDKVEHSVMNLTVTPEDAEL